MKIFWRVCFQQESITFLEFGIFGVWYFWRLVISAGLGHPYCLNYGILLLLIIRVVVVLLVRL